MYFADFDATEGAFPAPWPGLAGEKWPAGYFAPSRASTARGIP
jgi:hypothetical protein